jgi:signal transduction histidine kinase/HPt (histidine-containing phosphotransfer) domain-containing protein
VKTDFESPLPSPGTDWLIGGGEMAKLIKAKDWSQTPLGPIELWPQSLRTVVSLVQASNAPISLAWGPHHVQIYNDGYWPICGEKHPVSMGQDYRECWAAPWSVIGDAYESARAGKSAYLENMRMFLDRYGFLEETWFTFSFSPITDESGEIAGLFHPVTELTAQSLSERRTQTLRGLAAIAGKSKTAEDTFANSAALFAESNLDVPFALFYLFDEDGRSARLMTQTGVAAGTSASPIAIDLDSRDATPWPIAAVARSGQAQQVDDVAALLAGMSVGPYEELPKTAFALPINLPGHDKPAGVMIAGVSARLRINEPYRGFLDLVVAAVSTALANARAHEDERRNAEALAEIDRAKTAFFSNVSHEFRTPLSLMLGPLEDELNERDQPLPIARRERIETAHRNSLRLLKLVNGLLDFSRIEAGRVQALYESTDLATLTAELASSFRSAVERGGLTLTVDAAPLAEPVYVDREMWEKIVLNLLSNAFKHTFVGGIVVRLQPVDGGVELSVQDSGVGIAADEVPRLFERFHRVKGAASRTHEGSGIGLSLARELVQLHGGEMRVDSELGVGSRFSITLKSGTAHLPAERIGRSADIAVIGRGAVAFVQEAMQWLPSSTGAANDETIDYREAATLTSKQENSGPRLRVLWADDNADMREYVARLLGNLYDVQAVPDGQAALEAALASPPDLVLSDVMMPRLDGFGLLRALRENEQTRRLPVILLSARAGEESALEGLEAGADDYLVKPFSAKELLARVRSNLSLAQLRKEWEARLSQSNRELAEAVDVKGRFLATMSHEIRTPLNAVIGMAGLLADTPLNDEQKDFASMIRVSGDHLLTVINDILDYSKLESGALTMERVPYGVSGVVEEALDMVATTAREKKLELVYELAPDVPNVVVGDPGRVRQVLLNFLSNAVKFTETGEVLVMVEMVIAGDGGRHLQFTVRDTGIGLSAEQRGRLFRAFSQADSSTSRKYGGSGLGLAISRRLAELMGGDVWVESEIGQGSSFLFRFPVEVPEKATRVKWQESQASPLAGIHVWIVDDNDTNRRILRRQAESWSMIVRDTAHPAEALAWASKGDAVDLAILDFQMPEMDGAQLAEALHRLRGATLKQLMLSSVGVVMNAEGAQKIGLQGQLTKPVRHSALFNAIVKLFELKATHNAAATPAVTLPADMSQKLPLRILVAEDNPVNVKVITMMLARLGYRADVAGNGIEAIEALERQRYDVVLMDVQMPELDGIEATRRIHQQWSAIQRPQIIALTAGVMPEERRACLDAGMDDFLNKPIVPALLVQSLERCRQRPGASLPGFDSTVLTQLLQDYSADDVKELIAVFLGDAPLQINRMRSALAEGDIAALGRAVHSIKAVPAMLGAIRFAESCVELEQLVKASALDAVPQQLAILEEQFRQAAQALRGHANI